MHYALHFIWYRMKIFSFHHQTLHFKFFSGFIFDPAGHLKSFENASMFEKAPYKYKIETISVQNVQFLPELWTGQESGFPSTRIVWEPAAWTWSTTRWPRWSRTSGAEWSLVRAGAAPLHGCWPTHLNRAAASQTGQYNLSTTHCMLGRPPWYLRYQRYSPPNKTLKVNKGCIVWPRVTWVLIPLRGRLSSWGKV